MFASATRKVPEEPVARVCWCIRCIGSGPNAPETPESVTGRLCTALPPTVDAQLLNPSPMLTPLQRELNTASPRHRLRRSPGCAESTRLFGGLRYRSSVHSRASLRSASSGVSKLGHLSIASTGADGVATCVPTCHTVGLRLLRSRWLT